MDSSWYTYTSQPLGNGFIFSNGYTGNLTFKISNKEIYNVLIPQVDTICWEIASLASGRPITFRIPPPFPYGEYGEFGIIGRAPELVRVEQNIDTPNRVIARILADIVSDMSTV